MSSKLIKTDSKVWLKGMFLVLFGQALCFMRVLQNAGVYRIVRYTMTLNGLDYSSNEESELCNIYYLEVLDKK